MKPVIFLDNRSERVEFIKNQIYEWPKDFLSSPRVNFMAWNLWMIMFSESVPSELVSFADPVMLPMKIWYYFQLDIIWKIRKRGWYNVPRAPVLYTEEIRN